MPITVQQWVNEARAQIGTVESPPQSNDQKYGAAYGENGVAWCAIFQWWLDHNLGLNVPFFSPSVVETCQLAEQHGFFIPSTQAQPGDWIARSWQGLGLHDPGLDWSETHMQGLLGKTGSALDLIGGNQNDPSGGIVSYDTATAGESTILGAIAFSRLFTTVNPPSNTAKGTKSSDTKSPSHPNPKPLLYNNVPQTPQTLSWTKKVQAIVGVTTDGIFGPITAQAVRNFQQTHNLAVDGVVGPMTYKAMGL